jgi:hypothetical protein
MPDANARLAAARSAEILKDLMNLPPGRLSSDEWLQAAADRAFERMLEEVSEMQEPSNAD